MDKSVTAVVIKVGCLYCACDDYDVSQLVFACCSQCMELLNLEEHSACLQGLAEHKDSLGAPLCPCRHYDDKQAEAVQGFWNCPCVPMRERKVGCCPKFAMDYSLQCMPTAA